METPMLSPDRMPDVPTSLAPLSSAAADYDVVRRAIAHIKGNWRTQPEVEEIAEASGEAVAQTADDEVGEVIVTGSRIKRADIEGVGPATVIAAEQAGRHEDQHDDED